MRSGLFSVSYAGLWGQRCLSPDAFLEKASTLGFDGVLLMAKRPHLAPLDYIKEEDKEIQHLRDILDKNNLELIGLAAYNDFLMDAPAEVHINEMQIAYIEACCRITAKLGGTIVRIYTGYEKRDLPLPAQWERVVKAIHECGERAEQYGITLAVQNHHDLAVDTYAMEQLLRDINHPFVKAGYDAWSPYLRGEDLYESAKRMAPHMVLSIAANYRRFKRYSLVPDLVNYEPRYPDLVKATSMYEGEIDYATFLRGLQDGGYEGWFVYEMCSPLVDGGKEDNLDRKASDFLSFCNNY